LGIVKGNLSFQGGTEDTGHTEDAKQNSADDADGEGGDEENEVAINRRDKEADDAQSEFDLFWGHRSNGKCVGEHGAFFFTFLFFLFGFLVNDVEMIKGDDVTFLDSADHVTEGSLLNFLVNVGEHLVAVNGGKFLDEFRTDVFIFDDDDGRVDLD
jgi:hypothetical protein